MPCPYNLEVSSPGINRPLRTLEHFQRFLGEPVKMEALTPVDGRRRFKGTLKRAGEEGVVVEIDGLEYEVALDNIEKARLSPKIEI